MSALTSRMKPRPVVPLTCSVAEAARLLGVGSKAVRSAIKAGTVPSLKVGRKLRVSRVALEALLRDPAATLTH